ncbi:MAG: McrB family protein [Segatella copri]
MKKIVKHINDTNASYRNINAGDAKNTDLFLDNEHYSFFEGCGEEITVRFSKENLAKAILFIASILPRKFDQSATHKKITYSKEFVLEQLSILDGLFMENGCQTSTITQIWTARKNVLKKNGEIDTRFYFNGLLRDVEYTDLFGNIKHTKFTVRNYLAGGYSDLHIIKSDDGVFDIEITNTQTPYNDGINDDAIERIDTQKDIIAVAASSVVEKLRSYLTAMRTKPFLLLAGISGTGKSRIVKQMAFESCPEIDELRKDPTSPGNYQLVEVKPNWHDSTEVLGYESEIGGSHYVATPFVKFLVKAMQYEDKAPFFVCMDEMNLAPVEQYFAEFLSVLESRKLIDGKITSEPLIKADIFVKYESTLKAELFNLPKETATSYVNTTSDTPEPYGDFNNIYDRLKVEGLRIPSNLIVVGTVNMDETTHQFSRKVIDRAMTIEMNIEDAETPFKDFFEGGDALHYYDNPQPRELFLPKVVQAADALAQMNEEDAEYLKANIPQLLYNLNKALDGTPFKIAYRVQNELVLYFYSLREEKPEETAENLLASAMDAILMMKVLPRIEGDEDLLEKPLKALADFTAAYPQASKKIAEMQQRLPQAHFTSFWP